MRTSGQEKSMARLLFAGGALPPAVWLSQQQVVVTPAMAGNIRIPNPPESPEQLLDAPQVGMVVSTPWASQHPIVACSTAVGGAVAVIARCGAHKDALTGLA
jgi:hypothetical protein